MADHNQLRGRSDYRWILRLICCGREDGFEGFDCWIDADSFRNSYIEASGHERQGVIELVVKPPTFGDLQRENAELSKRCEELDAARLRFECEATRRTLEAEGVARDAKDERDAVKGENAELWAKVEALEGAARAETVWTSPQPAEGEAPDFDDRETLGKLVRLVWMNWAEEQPNPKPSWLIPWTELSEPDREVDRRIGETIAEVGAARWKRIAEKAEQRVRELEAQRDQWCRQCNLASEAHADAESKCSKLRGELAASDDMRNRLRDELVKTTKCLANETAVLKEKKAECEKLRETMASDSREWAAAMLKAESLLDQKTAECDRLIGLMDECCESGELYRDLRKRIRVELSKGGKAVG